MSIVLGEKEIELVDSSLKKILEEEITKIKTSVSGYIKKKSTKGISQMIGRRYGYMWESMAVLVFELTQKEKFGGCVMFQEYIDAYSAHFVKLNNLNDCCMEATLKLSDEIYEKTGTKKQDLCDLTYKKGNIEYGIDAKFRFRSNDSKTVRQIAFSAEQLKFLGYEPMLLFRKDRKESLKSPINRFEKAGWKIVCGQDSLDFIKTNTGFDLGGWIEANINIWDELQNYQEDLKRLRIDEENWKF